MKKLAIISSVVLATILFFRPIKAAVSGIENQLLILFDDVSYSADDESWGAA